MRPEADGDSSAVEPLALAPAGPITPISGSLRSEAPGLSRRAWRGRRDSQAASATRNTRPPSNKIQRNAPLIVPRSDCRQLHGFVDIDRDQPRYAGLIHGHADELRGQLHRDFVMGDKNKLPPTRHLAHDLAIAPDIVFI